MNKTEILAGIRTHAIWMGMKMRCTKPKTTGYKHYGGRGISFCDRWNVFENFLDDLGLPRDGESIDRIDPNGNYEPGNCRWANSETQSNNRRNNLRVTFAGETLTLSQWSRKTGIPRNTLVRRYNEGCLPEIILQIENRPPGIETARKAMLAMRRAKTHCERGHEFSTENTYIKPTGQRLCKICRSVSLRRFRAKERAARHARGLKNTGRWAHLEPPIKS